MPLAFSGTGGDVATLVSRIHKGEDLDALAVYRLAAAVAPRIQLSAREKRWSDAIVPFVQCVCILTGGCNCDFRDMLSRLASSIQAMICDPSNSESKHGRATLKAAVRALCGFGDEKTRAELFSVSHVSG